MRYDSRKFIDEVHKRSSRWAIWSPPRPIEPGTYGTIDPQTGEFEPKGNIYHLLQTEERLRSILADQERQPQQGPAMEALYTILSTFMTGTDVEPEVVANVSTTANVGLRLRIEVNNEKRGAFLILRNPRLMYLPTEKIDMRELAKVPALEDMLLVTEVIKCPSFVMGLTSRGQRMFHLSFQPTPTGMAAAWKVEEQSAFLRMGNDPRGEPNYASLVKLIKMSSDWKRWFYDRFRVRNAPPKEPGADEIWESAYVPWGDLDDDGNQRVVVDDLDDTSDEEEDNEE